MKFNENLSALRKQKGLSQEELAEQLGVSRQAISKWENGLTSPEMAHIENICQILGTTPNGLLGYAEEVKPVYEEKQKPQKPWYKPLLIVLICILAVNLMVVGLIFAFTVVGRTQTNTTTTERIENMVTDMSLVKSFEISGGEANDGVRTVTVDFVPSFIDDKYEYSLLVIDENGNERLYSAEFAGEYLCRAEIELEMVLTYNTRLIVGAEDTDTGTKYSQQIATIIDIDERSVQWK